MAETPDTATLQRVAFASGDQDETEDFIRQMYVGNRTTFLSVPEAARFGVEAVVSEKVSADRVRSEVDYVATCDPWDHFCFMSMYGGRIHMRYGSHELTVHAGEHSFYPVGVELEAELTSVDCRTVRVPLRRLETAAEELLGTRARRFRFLGNKPVSAAMAQRWDAVTQLAHSQALAEDSVVAYPLLCEQLLRTVAVTALHTFPNSLMVRYGVAPRARASSATLRRAMDFIEEHAAEPISVSDIAAAAGVTARALQYGFARHLDTTPMAYLRRVRLAHAHRELRDADPTGGATVAQIARRWGFGSPNRFAGHYRDAYGRPPSDTLRA